MDELQLGNASEIDENSADAGSCMVVVATDAPLDWRNLNRLGQRALLGLGRTGSVMDNGSGEFVVAFSTAYHIPHGHSPLHEPVRLLNNNAMNGLFAAVVEATEEAVYNSLFKATDVCGHQLHERKALPVEQVLALCRRYGRL